MPGKRPQITAQKQFLKHRESLEPLDLRRRFEYIFEENLWDSGESRSGSGSTLKETETLRREIPILLRETGAKSLLDIPCGDFRWLSEADLDVSYTGADIVEALVASNIRRYASATRRFLCLDLTSDTLPQADVVLCRDCLVHLSYANIVRALENIRRSGAKYLLVTNFLEAESNSDISDGDWRPLNFQLPPFNFPAPERVIVENCTESEGAFSDKSLTLWPLAKIPRVF